MYGCGDFYCPKIYVMVWSRSRIKVALRDVVKIKNELIRGETGWSSFEEREQQSRIVFCENQMYDLGGACLV